MNDELRLAEALEACIERMRRGGEDVESVLRDHEDLADSLRPLLSLADECQALDRPPSPNSAFRAELAGMLLSAPSPSTVALADAPASSPRPTPAAPATDSLVRALEDCLTRIRGDGADPAVVLAEYPEMADELRPLVATALEVESIGPIAGPTESYRARLAEDLHRAPSPRSLTEQNVSGLSLLGRLWRSTAATAAAAATVVLMMAFGAVYASADAQPGNWLYPFKRATEQARLWAVPDDQALWLHLGFADLRLNEALERRAYAGEMLSDFSGEVTAALAEVDENLLAGEQRERLAPPMLTWLFDARTRLVDGRLQLPPTAWRGSLALVDEAIRAMQSGQLAAAPVPRLTDPVAGLRAAAPVSRGPSRQVVRRRPAVEPQHAAGADIGSEPESEQVVYVVVPRPTPVQETYEDRPDPQQPTADTGPRSDPRPTERSEPEPTARPTEAPTDLPTTVPTSPATAPATQPAPPTPPEVSPTDPTPTAAATDPPTSAPSPTGVPVTPTVPTFNKPPVVDQIFCDDQRLLLGKSTMCHVVAYDPEGEELTFLWTSDVPEMLNRSHKDATYFAAWGASGGVMTVRITVHVSDQGEVDPNSSGVTVAETFIEVHPPGLEGR